MCRFNGETEVENKKRKNWGKKINKNPLLLVIQYMLICFA